MPGIGPSRCARSGEKLVANSTVDCMVFLASFLRLRSSCRSPGTAHPKSQGRWALSAAAPLRGDQNTAKHRRTEDIDGCLSTRDIFTSGGLHWIHTDKRLADGLAKVSAPSIRSLSGVM
eukprot:5152107-Alexandrium_andersonii.AAC.1